jgi:acyl dehydratase
MWRIALARHKPSRFNRGSGPGRPSSRKVRMPICYPDILDQRIAPDGFSYSEKDVMLYALGVGMGADPLDEDELPFVYERGLKVVPTAMTVLAAAAGGWPAGGLGALAPNAKSAGPGRISGLDYKLVVHGEQKVELHRPLPASGAFTVSGRTVAAYDKGAGKGAIVVLETAWSDEAGERVATSTATIFARGDGGFGGPAGGGAAPHVVPDRAPDLSMDIPTRPDQALLYRLNGDRNPLHSDPDWARQAGFERPILHGLCTYGITCRAVLKAFAGYAPERIASHQVRFSAPVFPGDLITVDLWKDAEVVSFEARVRARGVTVIKNGKAVLRQA